MVTIKHMHKDLTETICEAESIRFTPANYTGQDEPPTVWLDGRPETGGIIYVMNDAGATVGKYVLELAPL